MGRTAGAKRSTLTLQIKVKFNGIDNIAVDDCASEAISARITCKAWEEANMVMLANNDKGDGGAEAQFLARVSDEADLVFDNRGKLSVRGTAAIEQYPLRQLPH